MGKKKSTSASGSSKVSRDWGASEVSKLRSLGFISSSDDDIRPPGPSSRPNPPKGFTVMFAAFLFRGLSLPAHEFLRSLLFFYGIQLWQLTPNSILHLSIFITASTVIRCYPPTPESGVEPEDDDNSEDTEDAHHPLEDNDVQEEEAPEDDVLTRSRRRRRINDELITTAESSPSGPDNDADEIASPPPAPKSSANLFAVEDDLDLSDDDIPLAKRAQFSSFRPESGKESNPSPAKRTPPSRTTVEKIPVSKVIPPGDVSIPPAARDHPIYATVDDVADFAEQFTRLKSENAHLRKTIKTSADQVLEANRLATNAQNENTLLKDELKKLKQKVKDDQEVRRKATTAVDEKEGVLRESIAKLMSAADLNINRARKLREDSMSNALSLAAESNVQVLGLLQKTKGALSRLYSMIFPRMKQDKTLSEMAESFLIDPSEPVEVLKRRSHLFGAVLTFQLLMGHGLGSELERFSEALPVDDNGHLINLEPFKQSAVTCANQLLKLVDEAKTKTAPEAAPGSSSVAP
ncbi:hypothetical protein QYE76_066894 [Lolium multiflorum]|uniref:Transposase (putative) gypsy type domain-containing protein n=1 Tax=Lolium multiflorum TaxID=4521 RepID=A0AAD8SCA9_LOLMU|nr:hypothetical protein QYE76_066894 [Lolium multiflorum]